MKILTALAGVCAISLLVTFVSCTSGDGVILKSRADSLRFARGYFDKYPEENSLKIKYRSADSVVAKGVHPITWLEVEKYKKSYDKHPLIFSSDGKALNGFLIDSTGYALILGNKNIKGLYLRLGKKDDGAFTIMLLGTDAKGAVIRDTTYTNQGTYDTNGDFDNVLPCPTNCPPNFD
jgi:hypothetical protein